MKKRKNQITIEFGDFQTPNELANKIVIHLKQLGISPTAIIEPTCGIGSFILASLKTYPEAEIYGFDINSRYLNTLLEELALDNVSTTVELQQADFFKINWPKRIEKLSKPVLILGNPPWVTSSEIGVLGGTNIPEKSNIYGYQGLDTKTGKSNFDISEWMIIELLKALDGYLGTLAMLCKVSVARKILMYAQRENITIYSSRIHLIDAKEYFGASVEACLFICNLKPHSNNYKSQIYQNFDSNSLIQEIGYIDGKIIANIPIYRKWEHLQGINTHIWRSGIKHDCAKIMELKKKGSHFLNGFGELVSIENEYLYPMLKSSDLANNRITDIKRWMIVTQKFIGEETSSIRDNAPLTWDYLEKYLENFNNRASSIYNNRPKYAIFGVGNYSFFPWKIAISGFYKKLNFKIIGPFLNKPVVFDDTCYLISSESYEQAVVLHFLLNHPIAQDFYNSLIFWDSKRPITKRILQQLDLNKLSQEIGYLKMLDLIEEDYANLNSKKLSLVIRKILKEKS
ncbi:MAG: hypothetical protein ACXADY_03135 [Candidatus Hodarchaeales archaeon]